MDFDDDGRLNDTHLQDRRLRLMCKKKQTRPAERKRKRGRSKKTRRTASRPLRRVPSRLMSSSLFQVLTENANGSIVRTSSRRVVNKNKNDTSDTRSTTPCGGREPTTPQQQQTQRGQTTNQDGGNDFFFQSCCKKQWKQLSPREGSGPDEVYAVESSVRPSPATEPFYVQEKTYSQRFFSKGRGN